MVLDVIQVVLQLLHRIVNRRAVVIAHLRPAGEPWFDTVAHGVEGNVAGQLVDKIGALRARTDQTHVPRQDIAELRQLVDTQLADHPADTRHPIIIGTRPARLAVTLGVVAHAAKLDDLEQAAIKTNPLLPVEYREPVFEDDQEGGHQHHRHRQDQEHRRHHDIKKPLDGGTPPTLPESLAEDQPADTQGIKTKLTEGAFEVARQIQHPDAGKFAVKEFAQWESATATLTHRDDDLVDLQGMRGVR